MREFRRDGYSHGQEALQTAAQCGFAEQMTTVKSAAADESAINQPPKKIAPTLVQELTDGAKVHRGRDEVCS